MFRWRALGFRLRLAVAVVVAAGLLLIALAEIHACACTGGPPVWRSIEWERTPVRAR
jgi:hypothetical protein